MTASWVLISIAVLCLLLASALAQRELFLRDRQIELRSGEIANLHNQVEVRERRLEAYEILLQKLRASVFPQPSPE